MMNSIQTQPMAAGMQNNYPSLSDAQVANYMRKQSVSAYESINAGLTIQTKDGDVVTLTSNSFAQLDSYMYNSKGVLQTPDGTMVSSLSQREVTLATGESFTFSVDGTLSDDELEDIEDIVKSIDEIISEMASGDMEEAIEKAVAMGTYDTVSMYAADLSYEKNVAATVETRAQAASIEPAPTPEILPREESELSSQLKPYPENHAPRKKRKNSIKDINQFVERMTEKLEKHPEKLIKKSEKALDRLFDHHLRNEKKNRGSKNSAFNAIEKTHKKLNKYLDKMFEKLFDAQMSLF